VSSDPTLETLKLAESWQPANAPQRLHDVWFDAPARRRCWSRKRSRPDSIRMASRRRCRRSRRLRADPRPGQVTPRAERPGAFSVEIGGRTQREAGWIGTVDTLGLILLLWIAYRSWKAPLLGVLPLASAGLAGLGAVAWLFDGVHGITVAFGFTLIGVAQDYPIHLFSTSARAVATAECTRALADAGHRRRLDLHRVRHLPGIGVDGLKQLAVFTITGLATAALTTRFLLPSLIDPRPHDAADSARLERCGTRSRACRGRACRWRCWRCSHWPWCCSHPARSGRTTCPN
jgi:predicted exporter